MINQYPLWKNLLILCAVLIGGLYALPNLFGEDPALQISPTRAAELDSVMQQSILERLAEAGVVVKSAELENGKLLIRFNDPDSQLQAVEPVKEHLGNQYVVALNLAPATPEWLVSLGAGPMYLGLDLRGGVHFLMDVDVDAAETQSIARYAEDLRALLRTEKVRYGRIDRQATFATFQFKDMATRDRAHELARLEYRGLLLEDVDQDAGYLLKLNLSETEKREVRKFAVDQNITTLRNRINELGVAEPIVQQQGQNRIVVQLPGVQDTARAKEILGATATLEYRLVDTEHSVDVALAGRVPPNSKVYRERNGKPVLLLKRVIVTGDQITNASSGLDSRSGTPNVSVSLDSKGAKKMLDMTRENVGHPMAVVYIENKVETRLVDGKPVKTKRVIEEVISVANIREPFGKRFQTTGLGSTDEARDLALLLRAGALAAPVEIIEERTVGPSLGQDNIDQGFLSVMAGFVFVLIFMAVYYRVFGLVAGMALMMNLVLIVAVLSMLQATLTLPGIAGIVLTVGMAVDANVLIFERIREELGIGNSPQASIHAGYEKALSTIADANITTLIAAIVLFSFGTGPIKGFAVTLSIGIVTSMFTALMGTRAVINMIYGGRRVKELAI